MNNVPSAVPPSDESVSMDTPSVEVAEPSSSGVVTIDPIAAVRAAIPRIGNTQLMVAHFRLERLGGGYVRVYTLNDTFILSPETAREAGRSMMEMADG